MSKKPSKKQDGKSAAAAGDSRFTNFESDPRFRLPSKNRNKTTLDKRFSRMLKDDDFIASAKVDKYGRKLKSDNKKKALKSIYQADEDEEIEEDDVVERELQKADAKYDPARGGGFSSSESDSDSEPDAEDDQEEEEDESKVDTSASMQRLRDAQADVETGEVTRRLAIVNLDWDHIKSADLLALFTSFVPKGGRIERISIYPSEFGKERMQREELEGPPKEIFKGSESQDDDSELDSEDEDDDEDDDEKIKNELLQEGNDQDFDSDALRAYQLDRLRYYYAVMICSDIATANKIYQATDGTEYQTSSNFMDLRFIPDDVTFDDEPRDECDSISPDYKPTEFTTDALQHSKVKLTWDIHPEETSRQEDIKRAFSASRAAIEENDLRAYLASDSDDDGAQDDEDEGEDEAEVADDQPKLTKKELKAKKLREALGLNSEPLAKSSKSKPVGDMQVTFSAALMDGDDKKKKEPDAEETTLEKYVRKEKERKARKKEKAVAKRNETTTNQDEADGDDAAGSQDDLGFDDPFFTTEEPVKKSKNFEKKEERRKRREAKDAEAAENAAQKAHLERIMADDSKEAAEHLDHFNMNEIARAEKLKSKKFKKKGKKEVEDHGGLQQGFEMDVQDDRFKAVFESHEFAIDPSNPKFKATQGMKQLLDERRKKRKNDPDDADGQQRQRTKAKKQRR
ncbi:uncharacterized protein GGS22DRAFT_196867 [Annulohypoxylon maeteangense]|uniref:uncharacterized protein n=1 Tax=Annulohypoxylon maeteangense TaxID=1927788 RepID=UPI002008DD1B|nr:uncharacterized protein GGS22DRAFT_196867 [Annulohypoxylon maeteangense]KAI0889240.1 hypothetical protein GGS22DRAFT_196867 [Annulohypoxylon maeteangense]